MTKRENKYYEEYKDFIKQVKSEMRRLGIRQKDMPGYGISVSQTANVLRGYSRPGEQFCVAMARALKVPPIEIFEWAGIVPLERNDYEADEALFMERYRNLTPTSKHDAQEYIAMLLRRDQERNDKRKEQADRADNLTNAERGLVADAGHVLALSRRIRATGRSDIHPRPGLTKDRYRHS